MPFEWSYGFLVGRNWPIGKTETQDPSVLTFDGVVFLQTPRLIWEVRAGWIR